MRIALLAGLLLVSAPARSQVAAHANAPAQEAPQRPGDLRSSTWSFAILGDNRDDPDSVFPAVVQRIHADGDLVFVLHLGDMVPSGGESQLKAFLKISAPMRACFFPVIGNHEIRRDTDRRAFKAAFGLKSTSYSFTYRNVHVAVIDNASQEFSESVLKWLDADLERNKKGAGGIERVFVAMHIPPAGLGVSIHVEGDKAPRFEAGSKTLMNLLRAHSVDAIFAGHVHRAETVDVPGGPELVISGTAGAPQWWRTPDYGYHRVTMNGAEIQIDFVKVNKGQQASVSSARSWRPTCPRVESTEGG